MTQRHLPKLLMISHGSLNGGAARAASRLFECLALSEIQVDFLVVKKSRSSKKIKSINTIQKILIMFISRLDILICQFLEPKNFQWKTAAFFGVLRARQLNRMDHEVINLHWLGHGLISLRQLQKIKKPIIWTLHDEWALNPISHYPNTGKDKLLNPIKTFLLNNRMISKKKFLLNKNVNLITLNSTIAEQLKEWCPELKNKVYTIPNPVNTKEFYPMPLREVKKFIDVRISKPIVLFLGGTGDPRKGWDLLQESLSLCTSSFDLLMIGEQSIKSYGKSGQINIKAFPQIKNAAKLCAFYSLATAVVVPSRFEGLPQVATEALCCGTPLVGFDIGGIKDIIVDHKNGILVPRFDVDKFAQAIDCIVTSRNVEYRSFCRNYALNKFSFDTVGNSYKQIIIQAQKTNII